MERHQVEGRCHQHIVVAAKANLYLERFVSRNSCVPPIFESCQVIGMDGATPTVAQ